MDCIRTLTAASGPAAGRCHSYGCVLGRFHDWMLLKSDFNIIFSFCGGACFVACTCMCACASECARVSMLACGRVRVWTCAARRACPRRCLQPVFASTCTERLKDAKKIGQNLNHKHVVETSHVFVLSDSLSHPECFCSNHIEQPVVDHLVKTFSGVPQTPSILTATGAF